MTQTIRSATYGGPGGMAFDDSHDADNWGRITTIVVRHGRFIDAIQFFWENGNRIRHGGMGGRDTVITLQPDEFIVKVLGRSGDLLDQLTFVSNQQRTFGPFGEGGGEPFEVDFHGNALHNIFGQSGEFIDKIGFAHGPVPTPPPLRAPLPLLDELARQFCPVVYFHDCERYLPCSIEYLVQGSKLTWSGGEAAIANVDDLVNRTMISVESQRDVYQLDINESQSSGQPIGQAPMYYAIQEFADRVEITYVSLFAYQGGQTLRALRVGSEFNCIVYDYGKHQGDIEEITVQLVRGSDGNYKISRVGYEAHGDFHWFSPEDIYLENGHPIANSALNGHSMHNVKKEGTFVSEYRKEAVADFGSMMSNGNAWRPFHWSGGLKRIGLDATGNPINGERWAVYAGRIGAHKVNCFRGATYLDGRGLNAADYTFVVMDTAIGLQFDAIPDKYKHGIGPSGLATRPYIKPSSETQNLWRWCNDCHALFYCGSDPDSMPSVCVTGKRHRPSGSLNYILNTVRSPYGGQSDWRWCCQCGVLFYSSGPNRCPKTGGAHDSTKSDSYTVCYGDELTKLVADQFLGAGGKLRSPNKHYVCVVQSDGNFVITGPKDQVIWHSGTAGWPSGSYALVVQSDGNVVLCGQNGAIPWASGTGGRPSAANYLVLQNNANLVAYDPSGGVIWQSGVTRVDYDGQEGWRWCRKCGGMYNMTEGPAICAAGEGHDHAGSAAYGICFTHDRI